MGIECCKLVGNFELDGRKIDRRGIISISTRSSTDMNRIGEKIIKGPTIGSLTITAYADDKFFNGCTSRAGVSLNWINKYDCVKDEVHFIFAGEGKSYIQGDVKGLAVHRYPADTVSYKIVNASASSGPHTLYEFTTQEDGYGLSYRGGPWSFDTKSEGAVTFNMDWLPDNYNPLYLQSFNVQAGPNQLPVATYEFVYSFKELGGCTTPPDMADCSSL